MIQPHTSEWLCAQVVQLFESWAHHLSPAQFEEFGKPYAEQVLRAVREKHPETPLIYHGNGGDHPLFKLYHTRLWSLKARLCCLVKAMISIVKLFCDGHCGLASLNHVQLCFDTQ